MGQAETPHAGIFLTHDVSLNDTQLLSDAARTLRRFDTVSGKPVRRSKKRAAVMADHYGVNVRVQRVPGDAPYLSVQILQRPNTEDDDALARRILARTVVGMLAHLPIECIDWFDCETLIEPDDFREMMGEPVPPKHYDPAMPPPMDIDLADHIRMALTDDTEVAAVAAPGEDEAPHPRRGNFTFLDDPMEPVMQAPPRRSLLMRGVMAPLIVPKFLLALWRGMDLRLVARVSAVVALVVVLQNTNFLRSILYQVMH